MLRLTEGWRVAVAGKGKSEDESGSVKLGVVSKACFSPSVSSSRLKTSKLEDQRLKTWHQLIAVKQSIPTVCTPQK